MSENGQTCRPRRGIVSVMDLDHAACYRAVASRDRRFEGRFIVGVTSTGLYCRPGCPARIPKPSNVRFFPCAAAAAEAGLRPCARCRPELSPEIRWMGTSATVSRALRLIGEGVLDGGEDGVDGLAERLGVTSRHLRRVFEQHIGASPASIAITRRVHFARRLLDETDLPVGQVALASGFGSVRRFNDAMLRTFRRSPREIRGTGSPAEGGALTLRLPYKEPFDYRRLLSFLAARAAAGVEVVEGMTYRRTVDVDGASGAIEVRPVPAHRALELQLDLPSSTAAMKVVERVRRIFDLRADPEPIATHLRRDPRLAESIARRPGLRVPGAWDGFELAVRAILGQQVSVKGGATLAARLVQRFGRPVTCRFDGLERLFPHAALLVNARVEAIGVPRARADAIRSVARAATEGRLDLAVPGVGPWTAQYVAMRLGEPDAFPASDLGIRRALASGGRLPIPSRVEALARSWSPWRAYGAMHLWQSLLEGE